MAERSKTDVVVIHCADTYPDMDIGVKEIDIWHRKRGFLKVGYHYVIRIDGEVEVGREPNEPGAHALGYNHRSIGICMVGGKSRTNDGPENNFTDAQWESLKVLLTQIDTMFPSCKIVGHNEISKKACPSFNVQEWLDNNLG